MIYVLIPFHKELQKKGLLQKGCRRIPYLKILLMVVAIQSHPERICHNGGVRGAMIKEITVTTVSGEPCPCNGAWEIVGPVSTSAVFAKNQIVPRYHGKKVVWMLARRG